MWFGLNALWANGNSSQMTLMTTSSENDEHEHQTGALTDDVGRCYHRRQTRIYATTARLTE